MSDNNRMLLNKLLHVQNWIYVYQCLNIYINIFSVIRIINTCIVYCAHILWNILLVYFGLFFGVQNLQL